MNKKALVPVADGTEDLEAVAVIDILRRAGTAVTVASVTGNLQVKGSQGIQITTDCLISDCTSQAYDLVALPGGLPGVEHLRDSKELVQILNDQNAQGRLYGAICAAPAVVLQSHGLLENKIATCHPMFADRLKNRDSSKSKVIIDGNCITSRGAGTAIDFALVLVEQLWGDQKRKEVETGLAIGQ